jgi:hypothetical protein
MNASSGNSKTGSVNMGRLPKKKRIGKRLKGQESKIITD